MKEKEIYMKIVEPSEKELKYRKNLFKDVKEVLSSRLHCTCCLKDVKNQTFRKHELYIHPILKVLTCKDCHRFYGDGFFSQDEDGFEKYCKWCGQGGTLYLCTECPSAFCRACIKRNMTRSVRSRIENDDWKCFVCCPEPLYELRALAWALNEVIDSFRDDGKGKGSVSCTDANGYEGQLKSSFASMITMVRSLQKACHSFSTRIGYLTRTKESSSRDELNTFHKKILKTIKISIKKIDSISKKIVEDWEERDKKIQLEEKKCLVPPDEVLSSQPNDSVQANSSNGETERPEPNVHEAESSSENKSNYIEKCEGIDNNIEKIESNKELENEGSVKDLVQETCDRIQSDKETEKEAESIKNKLQSESCSEDSNRIDSCNLNSNNDTQIGMETSKIQGDGCLEDSNRIELCDTSKDERQTESSKDVHSDSFENNVNNTDLVEHSETGNSLEEVNCEVKSVSENILTGEKNEDSKVEEIKEHENLQDVTTEKDFCTGLSDKLLDGKDGSSSSESSLDSDSTSFSSHDSDSSFKSNSESGESVKNKSEEAKTKENVHLQLVKGLMTSDSSSSLSDVSLTPRPRKKFCKQRSKKDKGETKSKNIPRERTTDDEINRLCNFDSLSRKRKGLSNSSSDSSNTTKKKPVNNPRKKKKEEVSLLDVEGCMSSDSDEEMKIEIADILSALPSCDPCDLAKELEKPLSGTDRSYSSDVSFTDSDEKRKAKKIKKEKVKVDRESSSETDESTKNARKKKNAWRSDKLLRVKLSDSDSSVKKASTARAASGTAASRTASSSSSSDSSDSSKQEKQNSSSEWLDSSSSGGGKKRTAKRTKKTSKNSDDSGEMENSRTKGHRRNIRKVFKKDQLQESTQTALREEQERKKRIAERQKLYNQVVDLENPEKTTVEKLVLDFDPRTKGEILSVNKSLAAKLKPHQAEGVKFMWDSCFETIELSKNQGSGCILAHCMGLGKTLQVVTLIHTLLNNKEIPVKTVLVLCPLSTVLNWANEFKKWLEDVDFGEEVKVYHFSKSTPSYRASRLREWQQRGGVFLLGYNLFRTLVTLQSRGRATHKAAYLECLTDPGPDLVICDEGHILKNENTALSKAISKIKTLRRIVLTGTPLQNNLIEYHCMVQFVKPNLLGTKKEFTNRFVNPINNGQFVDSTAHDVKVMKRRAHVLHNMLSGIVQRKAYSVLVPFLPPKYEYVLGLSLTESQCRLYKYYLENFSRKRETGLGASLFKDRNMLMLMCAHSRLLKVQKDIESTRKCSDEEGSIGSFINDESTSSDTKSSSSDSILLISSDSDRPSLTLPGEKNRQKATPSSVEQDWWSSIITEEEIEGIQSSSKLMLFFIILKKCEEIGDKLLVFSQSLLALDLIEHFLDRIDSESYSENPPAHLAGFKGCWIKEKDYFRMDGRSKLENRTMWCKKFNDPDNRARLFLISTRAGGMGINLVGANRVIIFDASWNPSHDVQSIFRIYRFGQEKPCYVYRFLSKGTIEQKVYDRQVTKLSMACRVVDEQQIDRHYSYADLNELYTFTPNEKDGETAAMPKDRLIAEVIQEHGDLVLSYHTQDSMLENQEEEELNEEERLAAWKDFENEEAVDKTHEKPVMNPHLYRDIYSKVFSRLRQSHPQWPMEEVQQTTVTFIEKVFPQHRIPGLAAVVNPPAALTASASTPFPVGTTPLLFNSYGDRFTFPNQMFDRPYSWALPPPSQPTRPHISSPINLIDDN